MLTLEDEIALFGLKFKQKLCGVVTHEGDPDDILSSMLDIIQETNERPIKGRRMWRRGRPSSTMW